MPYQQLPTGTKLDQDKPDYTLLPTEFVVACAPLGMPTRFIEAVFALTASAPGPASAEHFRDLVAATAHDAQLDETLGTGFSAQHIFDQVVRVLEFGARKYSIDNWKAVPNAQARYRAAARRHAIAVACHGAHALDDESGLPHWAHALACIAFLAWFAEHPDEEQAE